MSLAPPAPEHPGRSTLYSFQLKMLMTVKGIIVNTEFASMASDRIPVNVNLATTAKLVMVIAVLVFRQDFITRSCFEKKRGTPFCSSFKTLQFSTNAPAILVYMASVWTKTMASHVCASPPTWGSSAKVGLIRLSQACLHAFLVSWRGMLCVQTCVHLISKAWP